MCIKSKNIYNRLILVIVLKKLKKSYFLINYVYDYFVQQKSIENIIFRVIRVIDNIFMWH